MSRDLLFFMLLICTPGCTKENQERIEFKFEIPLSVFPVKDTIQLGDTLYLEANFPDTIKEVLSGKYYKLVDFNFYETVNFRNLVDSSKRLTDQIWNIGDFTIINNIGSVDRAGSFGLVKYTYASNRYWLQTSIVPRRRGVHAISFLYGLIGKNRILDLADLGIADRNGTTIVYLTNIRHVINEGKTNFHLYKQHTKVGNIQEPEEYNYEKEATYTFVVN